MSAKIKVTNKVGDIQRALAVAAKRAEDKKLEWQYAEQQAGDLRVALRKAEEEYRAIAGEQT